MVSPPHFFNENPMSNRLIEITVDLLFDGEKHGKDANLYTDGDSEGWVAHSLLGTPKHLGGRTYEIEVPEWLAIKNSWI